MAMSLAGRPTVRQQRNLARCQLLLRAISLDSPVNIGPYGLPVTAAGRRINIWDRDRRCRRTGLLPRQDRSARSARSQTGAASWRGADGYCVAHADWLSTGRAAAESAAGQRAAGGRFLARLTSGSLPQRLPPLSEC